MRIEAHILYDKDDMRKLHHMTTRECINALEEIDHGTLPNNYVMLDEIMDDDNNNKEYSSDQYTATKYHAAMRQAITALRDIDKVKALTESTTDSKKKSNNWVSTADALPQEGREVIVMYVVGSVRFDLAVFKKNLWRRIRIMPNGQMEYDTSLHAAQILYWKYTDFKGLEDFIQPIRGISNDSQKS